MRIVVLNNYPLDAVWDEVRRGAKPDHHLYGVNHLQARGHEVVIVSASTAAWARRLGRLSRSRAFPWPIGHFERQWSAWRLLRNADVVYAPCGDEVNLLAAGRALGLHDTPVVALQHHALNPGRLAAWREPWLRLQCRGMAHWPALSRRVSDEINRAAAAPGSPLSRPITWGPDRGFYPRGDGPGRGVLAAGRTGRDFLTFGRAASHAGVDAHIVCLDHDVQPAFAAFASNVRVDTPGAGHVYAYPEMMSLHQAARVLAIPLYGSTTSLAGLTSLVDALALGKPVIMTRNPYIDLDVEALGIGRWVDPGDEAGWTDALRWFDTHPAEAHAMGRRARSLVDDAGHDSIGFAREIEALLTEATHGPSAARAVRTVTTTQP